MKLVKKIIGVAFNGFLCVGSIIAMIADGQGSGVMVIMTIGGFISATVILDK